MSEILELRDVAFSFPGERTPVFRNLTLSLHEGERVVLLGPNGSGKTTLLRILSGLYHPNHGHLFFRGESVDRHSLKRNGLRRRFRGAVSLLFQNADSMFFHSSVYEEIAYGPDRLGLSDVPHRVHEIAEQLDLATMLDRPPYLLSEGEKRRVALAVVLVTEPSLLLLDEPLAGLDPPVVESVLTLLEHRGCASLTSTHLLSSAARLGDRVLVLGHDHGLSCDGSLGEFLASADSMRRAGLA